MRGGQGGRRLEAKDDERRKLNLFSGSLMTSGSFTMMASAGMVGTGAGR